jgi:hypothetical protein
MEDRSASDADEPAAKNWFVKRQTKTILVAVAMIGIAVVFFVKRGKSDADLPTYQGKTVEEWFYGTNGHPGSDKTIPPARVAFAALGSNCIPYLAKKVQTRETVVNRFYGWVHSNLPHRMAPKLRPPITASYIQFIAWSHISYVILTGHGTVTDEVLAAVPKIEDDWVRTRALQEVAPLVRQNGREKAIMYVLPFLRDSSFDVQVQAATSLSELDSTITNGLPFLLAAASDTNLLPQAVASRMPTPTRSETFRRGSTNIAANWISERQRSVQAALQRISHSTADQNAGPARSP